MAQITEESITPNESGSGSIGSNARRWGQGHYAALFRGGKAVAVLDSPEFTSPTSNTPASNASGGELVNAEWVRTFAEAFRENLALLGAPTAPTPGADDDSTRIATTAWVQAVAAALKTTLEDRANHTGTQLAATISDFLAAVAASPSGLASHTRNEDTQLIGTAGALTADTLAAHLANAGIHTEIDDSATGSDKAFSAAKIIALINSTVANGISAIDIGAIVGLGSLAALNTVSTSVINDEAVTPSKLAGGPDNDAVANNRVYGVDGSGNLGFYLHLPAIGTVAATGRSLLVSVDDLLYVQIGTTASTAAAGNDARFPTANQKAALAGTNGAPGDTNRFVTQSGLDNWISGAEIDGSDLANPAPPDTPGLVAADTLVAAFLLRSEAQGIDLDTLTPSDTLGLVSAAELHDTFLVPNDIDPIQASILSLTDQMAGKLDAEGFAEQWEDGTVFDADVLDIDFPPANYAPRSEDVAEANDSGDLAAHLAGIDDKIGTIDGILDNIEANGVPADISASDVIYAAANYTEAADTVAGHFEGVDDALALRLSAATAIDPAEFKADKLHIQWEPSNYTPTSAGVPEADDNSDLTAHLKGIDTRLLAATNAVAASQAEAEAGTSAAPRSFSPLRIKQAIYALAGDVIAAVAGASPYDRQAFDWETELEANDHAYLFPISVAGTIVKVEFESVTDTGDPPSFRVTVNGTNQGTEVHVNTSTPMPSPDGMGTVRVARATQSIPVTAGQAVGVRCISPNQGNGSPAKGLRAIIWLEEAP